MILCTPETLLETGKSLERIMAQVTEINDVVGANHGARLLAARDMAEARKLLEESVAYARGLGFPPHHDYAKAVRLFRDVKASDSNAAFEFGKDGRPFYASGPYESPERVRQILAILSKTSGPAGPQHMVATDAAKALPGGLTPEQMYLLGPDQDAPEKVIVDSQAHVDPEK